MELLEGAPLIEHIVVLREKSERFAEARLWRVFGQLIQGLRYLHKEKKIVHRDLTPANVMLTEGDKLTISLSYGMGQVIIIVIIMHYPCVRSGLWLGQTKRKGV